MANRYLPDFIKKGKYRLRTEEQYWEHITEGIRRDVAVKLLTVLMTEAKRPLTVDEVLSRVRSWSTIDKIGKSFYFYWGQTSFEEHLDCLADFYGVLERQVNGNIKYYQVSTFGKKVLDENREALENYLGETFEEIKKTFPPYE